VERSRQSEYRTIQRTEVLLEDLRQLELRKDQVDKTLELSTFRGDTLQGRLTQALDRIDMSEDVVVKVFTLYSLCMHLYIHTIFTLGRSAVVG